MTTKRDWKMGNQMNGWKKGGSLLIFVIGVIVAGVSISHYLFAKAAVKEASNQQSYGISHPSVPNTQIPSEVVHKGKDIKLENAWIQPYPEVAKLWEKANGETNYLPESNPANHTEAVSKGKQTDAAPQGQNSSKKTIYLTFDDGPQAFSKQILALLEQHHFKATFFLIDGNIKKYPDAAKRMVQLGEGVGLHSVSHDRKKFYASVNSVLGELKQNRTTLKAVTGRESLLVRTPYGSVPYLTPDEKKAILSNGYIMWDWNIDSKDWFYRDDRYVASVIQQMQQRLRYNNGPLVILMHERKETLAHLPKLLDYLSKQNFDCKAIDSSLSPVQF